MFYRIVFVLIGFCFFVATGCAPVVVGGGATGGYKVATDERTAGQVLDDATITAKVKTELIKAEDVKARNIDVDTIARVVYLSGMVDSSSEIAQAVALAKKVPGVLRVKNQLKVGSRSIGVAFDDKVIGSKIKGKLVQEPGIRSLNVDVDVYQGVVTLTGVVESSDQKSIVMSLARSVDGVKKIIDNLKVQK